VIAGAAYDLVHLSLDLVRQLIQAVGRAVPNIRRRPLETPARLSTWPRRGQERDPGSDDRSEQQARDEVRYFPLMIMIHESFPVMRTPFYVY